MKIGRYLGAEGRERLGVVLAEGGTGEQVVLDLAMASAASGKTILPATMDDFIDGGSIALSQAYEICSWAMKQAEPSWFTSVSATKWLVPVLVRTCFAAGRNFGKHKAESAGFWKEQAVLFHNEIPMGFVKLARTMVATHAEVPCPSESTHFDYEVEAAAIIGVSATRVAEKDALKCVFGYTVFNDLSARDLQRKEMANQSILVGKNLPGFGPLGPWILTADEVPNPAALDLELRVNGDVRQRGNCSDMLNPFEKLIASWSSMGLMRGDLIAGGTPDGVAVGRPDPDSFYLRAGDRVEAEIRQIGVLETSIS